MIDLAGLLTTHKHPVIARALILLRGDWETADTVRWINTRRVLAEAWNPGRLATARARLARGEKAPAIRVVGYRLPGQIVLYEPEDGIHRTVAAREFGLNIKAKIGGYYQIRPKNFVQHQRAVWRRLGGWALQMVDAINDDEAAVLIAIGVVDMEREAHEH